MSRTVSYYFPVKDSGGGGEEVVAENVSYDNTTSSLTSENVQGAIDELANEILGINDALGSGVIE